MLRSASIRRLLSLVVATILNPCTGGLRSPLADHRLQPLTPEHVHHPLPQQDRRLQEQAAQGPAREILPRVHRWRRHQQSGQVYSVEVHAGESSAIERVPSVRYPLSFLFDIHGLIVVDAVSCWGCSLTQATDTSNIRLVFAAVKETILQNALKDSGIL